MFEGGDGEERGGGEKGKSSLLLVGKGELMKLKGELQRVRATYLLLKPVGEFFIYFSVYNTYLLSLFLESQALCVTLVLYSHSSWAVL